MDDTNDDPRDPPFKKKKVKLVGTCVVCGDKASSMNHYGSKVCFSCRGIAFGYLNGYLRLLLGIVIHF